MRQPSMHAELSVKIRGQINIGLISPEHCMLISVDMWAYGSVCRRLMTFSVWTFHRFHTLYTQFVNQLFL